MVMEMTPAQYDDDMPTNREMYRTLCDFREEWRLQMAILVRKDVYTVEQAAFSQRLLNLEQAMATDKAEVAKERAALKSQFNGVWFTIVASVVAAAVIATVIE